ncbi:PREDICTED: uncharacterized protein LOC108550913 [Eufriesea mexicana]|uniref:uncharacterized protein LOC108550913 n=1 Tax=Eufriesea mexicana TaxID=516756 RepID=UPI00083BE85B|nr:PREDICTED: uncharacterized protein LOC108550913 [Eufriesea mexicana]
MATALLLLGLIATCFGQMRYPDDDSLNSTPVPTRIRQFSTNEKVGTEANRQQQFYSTQTASSSRIVYPETPRRYWPRKNSRKGGFVAKRTASAGLMAFDAARTTSTGPIVFPNDSQQYALQTNPQGPLNMLRRYNVTQITSAIPMAFAAARTMSTRPIVFPKDSQQYSPQTNPQGLPNMLQEYGATRTTSIRRMEFPAYPQQHRSQENSGVPLIALQRPDATQTTLSGPIVFPEVQYPDQADLFNPKNALQDWGEHVNDIIVNGVLKFALDVEREIYRTRSIPMIKKQDNIIFSPISLTVALAIILAGSAGRTFDEATKVLGLEAGVDISRNSEIVHQMFGIMLKQLDNKMMGNPGPRIDFATATYVQDGFPILTQFKALSNEVYQTEVINVDFARNANGAEKMINAWLKEKTMGKITNILNGPPSPDTMMILLSALYFNGEWNQYFFDGATKRRPFSVEPNESVDVDMMYNGGTFPFYEDKQLGVKILGLPYKGHELSMYVLLPKAPGAKALREFANKLTVDMIENLVRNTKNETCIIGFPRMKLSSSISLKTTLESLGLRSLFNPALADLSLLSQINNRNIENTTSTSSMSRSTMTTPSQGSTMTTPSSQDRLIVSRLDSNGDQAIHMVKRNFFTYQDKHCGYTVKQWRTGFSIKKIRCIRDVKNEEDRNSYTVGLKPEGNDNNAKVVNLEENKYRFQKEERARRRSRQSRPINQDFVNFVKKRNFPTYGLDKLRNSANLINPHIAASDVLQKVEIDITEKGTEAAAVTSVTIERDASQKRLIANRPFIFFIRHESTRLVLFWGTINVPTPNYPAT